MSESDTALNHGKGKRGCDKGEHEAPDQKRNKKGHTGDKNIPAHRGAYKRHLRKHTSLFQREGGGCAKGFLVTCDQGKEAACITSVVKILKLVLDDEVVSADGAAILPITTERSDSVIEDKCREEQKPEPEEGARAAPAESTWFCDAGCNGVVCVTLEKPGVDPVRVLSQLWKKADSISKDVKFLDAHKFCHRFLPFQVVCRAILEEIAVAAKPLIDRYFASVDNEAFSIMCDVRSCSTVEKSALIKSLASLVDPKHKVNLSKPQVVIMVQIFKSACGIAIVPEAQQYLTGKHSAFNLLGRARLIGGLAPVAHAHAAPKATPVTTGADADSRPTAAAPDAGGVAASSGEDGKKD